MLQALEKFWMDYGQVIVLISASVTLIGVVFNLLHNNSISEKAVDRTDKSETLLSTEHTKLSTEHAILLDRANDSKAALADIGKTLTATERRIIESEMERKLNFASLSEAQRELAKSAGDMGKFSSEFSRVVAENQQIKTDDQALRQENERLKAENQNSKQKDKTIQLLNAKVKELEAALAKTQPHQKNTKVQTNDIDEEWEQEP